MAIEWLDRHRRVTVMGLGLFGGGLGAARFWRGLGADVTVTDLRTAEQLAPSVKALEGSGCRLVLGRHEKEDFTNTDLLVVNPAVKPSNEYIRLARSAGAQVMTETGIAFRMFHGPLIAVTGSNGKSTTTSLLGAMCSAHDEGTLVGGNIGGSLLEAMSTHTPSSPIVAELSSFQLHHLKGQKIAPTVAVVTNLSPNHLDWHKTLLHYYESKRHLIRFQSADNTAVLNADDPVLREWAALAEGRVIMVSLADPGSENACYLEGELIRLREKESVRTIGDITALRLPGAHNRMNALMAAAACYAYCGDVEAVNAGMRNFGGLPSRLETVAQTGGIRFVNDSIATTPESAICGLASFTCPRVLIAGGYDKGSSFDELGGAIVKGAHAVVLIGKTAPKLREAILKSDSSFALKIHDAGTDFTAAVQKAYELCPDGGVVLLSPACASYDMFTNFEERAEKFRSLAREIAAHA